MCFFVPFRLSYLLLFLSFACSCICRPRASPPFFATSCLVFSLASASPLPFPEFFAIATTSFHATSLNSPTAKIGNFSYARIKFINDFSRYISQSIDDGV